MTNSTITRCATCGCPTIIASGLGNSPDTLVHADMLDVTDGHEATAPTEDEWDIDTDAHAAIAAEPKPEPTISVVSAEQYDAAVGGIELAVSTGRMARSVADGIIATMVVRP